MPSDATTKKEKGEATPSTPARPGLLQIPSGSFELPEKKPSWLGNRNRSQSAGAIDEHGSKEQSPRRLSSSSTTEKEGNDVVSIPLGAKAEAKGSGLGRRRSVNANVKDAFRTVVRKVTRVSDDIAAMAIDIKEDTMDISKTAVNELGLKDKKSLCKDCIKMNFEECLPGDGLHQNRRYMNTFVHLSASFCDETGAYFVVSYSRSSVVKRTTLYSTRMSRTIFSFFSGVSHSANGLERQP
jgi:hypothetical protein